jgi:2-polyprenyl-3-methyl-5-hydroxy-6-metoxy-1,4-benzoquinol methylase
MGRCRLCAHQPLQPKWRLNAVTVSRCPACGFLQVQERPTRAQMRELYGQAYFEHGKYVDDMAWRLEQKRRLAWMSRCGVAPGARVLDAGCAAGDGLLFAKRQYEMWGLDISAQAVEMARAKNPDLKDRLRAGPLEDADFPKAYFDAIVMWDVIEHLWDPKAALAQMARLLKPGGRLCLSTPDLGSPAARLLGKRWAFMTPPEHLGFFARGTMGRLLTSAGLEMTRWRSKGKWVNAGFGLYKLGRVFPGLMGASLMEALQRGALSGVIVYVPTSDVAYVGGRLYPKAGGGSRLNHEQGAGSHGGK